MIEVKNNITGDVERLHDDSNLPQLVESGQVALPNKEFEFESDTGEKFAVPANSFLEAVKSGWKYRSQSQIEDEKLQEKYGNKPLAAALLATGRGLSLGLSDVLLEKSGALSQEYLSETEKRNKGISTTAEVVANIAPAILSGGSSVLAKAASKTAPGIIARLARQGATRAAQNVESKLLKGVATLGIEGAIEGAGAGLQQTISESELGDAEFNAETLLANVGTGALIGGGLGGAFGAGTHYIKKVSRGAQKQIQEKLISQVEGDDAVKEAVRKRILDQESIEDGLAALKDPEIQAIKEAYPEAPITPGMESALRPVKNAENYLFDAPTAQGEAIRRNAKELEAFVEKNVDEIWSGAREAQPEEAGNLIRQTFFSKVNEPWESGKAFYGDLMEEFGNAPVSDRYRTELSNIVKNSDAYRIGAEGTDIKRVLGIIDDKKDLLRKHADELELLGLNKRQIKEIQKDGGISAKMNAELNASGVNLREFNNTIARHAKELPSTNLTLKQIKELQSDIGASIKTTKGSERKLLRETYDQLRTMQDSIIRESVGDSKSAEKIIKGLDAANADYVRAYQAKDEIADLFGVKGSDFDTVLEKLENMSAIDLEKKFLNIKKTDKAFEVLQKYPEIGKIVLANRQSQLLKKHITQNGVNYAGIKKDLLKMSPQERALYFGGNKAKEKKLIDMLTLYEKRPKTLNPSGTDIRKELRDMLSPKTLTENWILGEMYKGNKSVIGRMVNKVIPALNGIEQSSNRTKNTIAASVSSFFKAAPVGVSVASLDMFSEKEMKKAEKNYELVQTSPEKLIEKFTQNNKDLIDSAPETANALQQRIIAGVQFLKSKTPQRDQIYIGENLQPSRGELLRFNDYMEAVENPRVIFKQMKEGYVNPNSIEALRTVYPKMFGSIQAEMLAKLPKKLTRSQKIQLQPILGSKVTPAMDYRNLQILQGTTQSAQASQPGYENKQTPITAAKNIDLAGRTKTGLDKTLFRT